MLTLPRLLRSMRLDREEGQVLPLFAAAIAGILIMTGVVVDGGNLFQSRQSLQNAADASAIAAALYIADPTQTCAGGGIGDCAGVYAGLNGAKDQHGDVVTQLSPCAGSVTDTSPPPNPPGCYVYPYTPAGASSSAYVEVWLTQNTPNFFGGILGFATSTESARAVGALTAGNPPPITFAALDDSCDNHTLLIKAGGNLKVDSGIYVNSCNDHDGFDIFGGGSIAAPKIETHGGWETKDLSTVYVPDGTLCSFPPNNNGNWKIFWNPTTPGYEPTMPGCPDIGQPEVADPFANFPPAPDLGPGNVGVPISIAKVSRGLNGVGANNASVVTASPHGLTAGDSVTISGVGAFGGGDFDGTYTVATVPDATTFTYGNTGSNVPSLTERQVAGGVVTLTTNAPTTLATGGPDTSVTVSGINSFFNFIGSVTAPLLSGVSTFFSYPSAYADPVTKKALQQGTATLTLATTAGLVVGDKMIVTGVDPLLDTPANSPVTITACCGGTTIKYADPSTTTLNVTKKAIANGTTVTLTTSPNNHVFAGDQVTVNLGDSRFDGTFAATAGGQGGGGATFKYTIPAVTASITNGSVSGGVFTLTTASGPPIENGDTVAVTTGLLAYDGSGVVSAVNTGSHTFVYQPGTFQNSSWTYNSAAHTVTLTTASAHGLRTGNVITVTKFGGAQTCMNVANATVTVGTATTFTYDVPAACNPGASGTQKGTITVVTAASHAVSGTVSLTTASIPVSPTCSNCVTAPAYIASVATSGGSVTLWDSDPANTSGTFTPSWMPIFSGVISQNFPGSPGIPSPYMISTGNLSLQPGTYYGGICIGADAGSTNCVGTAGCKAVGGTTTTAVAYSPAVTVNAAQTGDDTNPNYDKLSVNPSSPITVGDVIAVEDEEETVTAINGNVLTVDRAANGTEEAAHAAGTPVLQVVTAPNGSPYAPAKQLAANATAAATSLTVNSTNPNPIGVGDIIQIEAEAMTVTAIPDATHLTVTRGIYGTTPAAHAKGQAILKVFDASAPSPPTVTLAKGVYIMAGGGFSVCGGASVNAPDGVMIYNTNDLAHPAGYGALGQVNINTSGVVHLHPMTDGIYAGMTIFQDRSLTLFPGNACGGKGSDTKSDQWDIALQSAAPLGANGELASVTGTIYAPSQRADFGDTMSGTSNLVIITSCIYINGANSTFLHNPGGSGLFGVSATLGG